MKYSVLLLFFSGVNLMVLAQDHTAPIYSAEKEEGNVSRYHIFNSAGKPIFDEAVDWAYSNGWSWIFVVNKKTKLITVFNHEGVSLKIDSVQETQSAYKKLNLVALQKNDKWGFYNRSGELVIPHQFDEVSHFSNNVAAVKKGAQIYMIDTLGNKVNVPYLENDRNYSFEDGDIAIGMGGDFYHTNYKKFQKKKKVGLTDTQGNILIPAEYDYLFDLKEKFKLISARQGDKYGVVRFGNEIVIPITYKSVFVLNAYF